MAYRQDILDRRKLADRSRRVLHLALVATFLLTFASTIFPSSKASAVVQNCTWVGGTNTDFSTATNWTDCGGGVPLDGDTISIDVSASPTDVVLTNDLTVNYSGINVVTTAGSGLLEIAGDISVGGPIGISGPKRLRLSGDVTLSANAVVTGFLELFDTTAGVGGGLNLGAYNLSTFNVGSGLSAINIYSSAITGTGNLALNADGDTGINRITVGLLYGGAYPILPTDISSWTGDFTVSHGFVEINPQIALSADNAFNIGAGATLRLFHRNGATVPSPLTLEGSSYGTGWGKVAVDFDYNANAGDAFNAQSSVVWSGPITLNSNVEVSGTGNFKMTGTAAKNGHTITVLSGENATITDESTVPPVADTTDPTVSLTAPAAGTVSGTVDLTATASDNVGVAKVEFYKGATKLGEDTTAPYNYSWDTTAVTNGSFDLTAKAFDAAGNSKVSDPVTTVVVSNAGTPAAFEVTNKDGVTKSSVALSGSCAQSVSGTNATITVPTDLASKTMLTAIGFTSQCASSGGTVQVTIDLGKQYGDLSGIKVYKDQSGGTVKDITTGATIENRTVSGKTTTFVIYSVTDGSAGDTDGLANGTVVDPVYVLDATTVTPAAAASAAAKLADTGTKVAMYASLAGLIIVGATEVANKKQSVWRAQTRR